MNWNVICFCVGVAGITILALNSIIFLLEVVQKLRNKEELPVWKWSRFVIVTFVAIFMSEASGIRLLLLDHQYEVLKMELIQLQQVRAAEKDAVEIIILDLRDLRDQLQAPQEELPTPRLNPTNHTKSRPDGTTEI